MRRFLLVFYLIFSILVSNGQIISNIRIIGNSKTKSDHIIKLSELTIGDTIPLSNMEMSLAHAKDNLINSRLFNAVKIQSIPVDEKFTEILIQVSERWYVWPIPDLEVHETNFNTWLKSADLKRLSYGIDLAHQNVNGTGGQILILGRLGYIKAGGIEFRQPYLCKSKLGLDVHFSYAERSEVVYATQDNLRLFYTNNIRQKVQARIQGFSSLYYRFSPSSYLKHQLSVSHYQLDDSLARLNSHFPDFSSQSNIVINTTSFRSDGRDRQFYPLNGHFLEAKVSSYLFSGRHYTQAYADLRTYNQLSESIYIAAGLKAKISSSEDLPYYLFQSLGYEHYVRGYEAYVIDGAKFALLKTNIKFKILDRNYESKSGFPSSFNAFPVKIYANLFADAGYVSGSRSNYENSLQDHLLSGIGLGIDVATLYDRVIRFEFAYNRLNEAGLFVHFTQPI